MVLKRKMSVGLACALAGILTIDSSLAAQEGEQNPFGKYTIAWSFDSGSGSYFHSQRRDLDREGYYKKPTVWVRGEHSNDASVKYRTSLVLFAFDCDGKYGMLAFTSYDPSGNTIDDWDTSIVRWEHIRPDTMASSLENAICHS